MRKRKRMAEAEASVIFVYDRNCFPIIYKHSAKMRTRAKRKYVVGDRARRENVLRHIEE